MKVYIRTLGCEKNTVDSECAAGLLEKEGFELTDDFEAADVLMVNTCGFINDAKKESIDTIIEFGAAKREDQKLLVTGCLSQRYGQELKDALPEVDVMVGVNDYDKLPNLLKSGENTLLRNKCGRVFTELGARKLLDNNISASIKIAEGCFNACSYCSIPLIRGGYRSRKPEDILFEARFLASEGIKELVVIAQDTTGYGRDLDGDMNLAKLLKELCKIDGFKWIRLMYCYEDEITDELIDVIANEPKMCKYLDIPVQHASDSILKAMHRNSTEESIRNTVIKLRKQIPDIVLRTTFMVGFPGETAEDFKTLVNFVKEIKFDRLGVFAYSKEEGTIAYKMKNQVRKDVKERRRDKIMALQREISLENNQKYIGKTLEVLVEDVYDDGSYSGRTSFDTAEIDNGVIFTSVRSLKKGDFVKVLIEDAFDYDLSGKAL